MLDGTTRGPLRLKVPAGPQTIGVAVVAALNARGVDDLYSELAGVASRTWGSTDHSIRRGRATRPAAAGLTVPFVFALRRGNLCAHDPLSALATRASVVRWPLRTPRVDTLMGFFESGRTLRGFETGIQYALARVLVDPQFIFRFEHAPAA